MKLITAIIKPQKLDDVKEALVAAYELTKIEGIIPALETAHALAVLPKMQFKKDQVVVINLSGRGDKDLETYINHLEG